MARLDRAGRLPPASALLPAVLDELDLPGPAESLVEAIPEDTVDSLAPTGPILRRAVRSLDVQELLGGLGDSDGLEDELRDAVAPGGAGRDPRAAAGRLPESLRGLLGE